MKYRKIIAMAAALAAMMSVFAGCEDKPQQKASSSEAEIQDETEEVSTQPDPLDPKNAHSNKGANGQSDTEQTETAPDEEEDEQESSSDAEDDTESGDEPATQVDPLGGGAFAYDENGAVVFEDEQPDNDRLLIAAAQALYTSACTTEWTYTVGCPYALDYEDYIENEFGWRFSRITDENIHSMADLLNDYYKVFSDRYPNQLDELYVEQDGSVYALDGARGKDLYYSFSQVSGIQSRTDDEIFFNVDNYYDGTDFDDSEPYSVTDTFSVVIEDEGTWKAGEFRLPY